MSAPDLGAANSLRPSPNDMSLIDSRQFAQADPGTQISVHRVGVRVYAAFGYSFGGPPSVAEAAAKMVSDGQASEVYYMECWKGSHTVLGSGYDDFWFIGIYR